MFATLLGGLPTPGGSELTAVVLAQEDAGLEPITDGRLRDPGFELLTAALTAGLGRRASAPKAVDGWRSTAELTDRAVKQALPGPYTLGRRTPPAGASRSREAATMAFAEGLRRELEALAAAGCPMVEIEELDLHLIGEDDTERRLFREAHDRLTDGVGGTHLSLSIVGGSAGNAGAETILGAPYASFAFDLIAGPENWDLATKVPGERGVIAGVLAGRETLDEPKEVQLWAAHYAASTGGRGLARVGIGSAGSWAKLTWDAAVRKMRLLGETARLATLAPGDELARSVDAASVSARRAALGHPPAASEDAMPDSNMCLGCDESMAGNERVTEFLERLHVDQDEVTEIERQPRYAHVAHAGLASDHGHAPTGREGLLDELRDNWPPSEE